MENKILGRKRKPSVVRAPMIKINKYHRFQETYMGHVSSSRSQAHSAARSLFLVRTSNDKDGLCFGLVSEALLYPG